jgi:hypothetical protein
MTGIFTLLGAVVGALIGSSFLVLSQWQEARERRIAAARALLIEVIENARLAHDMVAPDQQQKPFPQSGPNPGFFNRQVWDSQMPIVAQILDLPGLKRTADAYMKVESVLRTRLPDGSYPHGKWIPQRLLEIRDAFNAAEIRLRDALDAHGKADLEERASEKCLARSTRRRQPGRETKTSTILRGLVRRSWALVEKPGNRNAG